MASDAPSGLSLNCSNRWDGRCNRVLAAIKYWFVVHNEMAVLKLTDGSMMTAAGTGHQP